MSTATPPKRSGPISYESALEAEYDVLRRLAYGRKSEEFLNYLEANLHLIGKIVSIIFDVPANRCRVENRREAWRQGSFNICIPVLVARTEKGYDKLLMMRIPLPYKVGEEFHPGNVDEKLRCEAATYIWLAENCPDVPIPRLWGFGLKSGKMFAATQKASFWSRPKLSFKQSPQSQSSAIPTSFTALDSSKAGNLGTGFLLIDLITREQGQTLFRSWRTHKDNKTLRANFFHDLAAILTSISRIPHPRIGSYTFNDDSTISLSNRPLTHQLAQFENDEVPTGIARTTTYDHTDSYLSDLLRAHDKRLKHQANSIMDREDGRLQASILAIMRAMQPSFVFEESLKGPFIMTLTDLHSSNIIVDENWHITAVIDLEWACTRPIEMVRLSDRWLSSTLNHIDEVVLRALHEEVIAQIMVREQAVPRLDEDHQTNRLRKSLSSSLRKGWDKGGFWYFLAVDEFSATCAIFRERIQALFTGSTMDQEVEDKFVSVTAPFWTPSLERFLDQRMRDRENYAIQIEKSFQDQVPVYN